MTRPPPPQDAEYLRRLSLGILSILEQKGILTDQEVTAILRAAQQSAAQPPAAPARPAPAPTAATRWVKPGQPHQPLDTTTPIQPPKSAPKPASADPEALPPVIDMTLE